MIKSRLPRAQPALSWFSCTFLTLGAAENREDTCGHAHLGTLWSFKPGVTTSVYLRLVIHSLGPPNFAFWKLSNPEAASAWDVFTCPSTLSGMWLHSGLLSWAPLLAAAFHAVRSFSLTYILTIQRPCGIHTQIMLTKKNTLLRRWLLWMDYYNLPIMVMAPVRGVIQKAVTGSVI